MPPPGPTEPTLQPVPSLEHGATLALAVCRAALGKLEIEMPAGAITATPVANNAAPIKTRSRRARIMITKPTYFVANASTGKSRSPSTIAVTIRAATASGVRPIGIFGATPAIARDAKPVSVCGGRASITSI